MNFIKVIEKMPVYIAGGKPSSDTINAYRRAGKTFINWLIARGRDVDNTTSIDAKEYVHELYQTGLTSDTVNQRIAAGRAFFRTAIAIGEFTENNPFDDVKGRVNPIADETTKFFTPEEIQKIFDTCTTDRERAIILLMAIEGLRTIEVQRMNIADYEPNNGRIKIHGKGDKTDYIYPADKTQEVLQAYISDRTHGAMFINDIDGSPITRDGIKWLVNHVLRMAGMKRKGISCHALRHSCGTNLYKATKDIRLVQETLRHNSPEVTARYAHVTNRKNATNIISVK